MEEILLYNISLKYLHKSLDKLRNNKSINIPLLNAISKKYLLGNNYLIYSDIYNNDIQQIKHIEQILIEIIKKLSNLKKYKTHIMPSSPRLYASTMPSSPRLYASTMPSSPRLYASTMTSSPRLYASTMPSSTIPSSTMLSSTIPSSTMPSSTMPSSTIPSSTILSPLSTSIIPPSYTTTTNFLFRPGKKLLDEDTKLDTETCINQLLFLLHNNKIIDDEGNIDKSKKLPTSQYIEFVRLMKSTKSKFSVLQIDDCLRQLGVYVED